MFANEATKRVDSALCLVGRCGGDDEQTAVAGRHKQIESMSTQQSQSRRAAMAITIELGELGTCCNEQIA